MTEAFGKQAGVAMEPSPSFYIHTDEKTKEIVDEILCLWVKHRPKEVMAFSQMMDNQREVVSRMPHTGAVRGRDERGRDTFSIDMEIPSIVCEAMTMMFGQQWMWDEKVYRIFRQEFTLGRMNPNPKPLQ